MGAIEVYQLAPRAPFHFGLRGVGVEETAAWCPADTLFGALCITLSQWESAGAAALEAWLDRFPPANGGAPPPVRFSSALPYAGPVRFYPKPMLRANLDPARQRGEAKKLKKITFVSERILNAWLSGEPLDDALSDRNLLHKGRVWVHGDERSALNAFCGDDGELKLWAKQTVPRVTVDRVTSHSAVYQAGVLRFKPGAGLYLLVEHLDETPAERKRFKDLLTTLGHSGLGGERSSGYGQFEAAGPYPFEGWGPAAGDRFLTLAPYAPTWAEVQGGVLGEAASYDLQTRRGWVGAPGALNLRRRVMRVLGEGSVLCATGNSGYGALVDVTPHDKKDRRLLDYTVWRYGIAFPVPVSDTAGKPRQEEGR